MIWVHVTAVFAITITLMAAAYAQATNKIGALQTSSIIRPVDGNVDGSYATMWSYPGLLYGLVMVASSPGAVLADQTFWQVCNIATGRRKVFEKQDQMDFLVLIGLVLRAQTLFDVGGFFATLCLGILTHF
jgi:hypothetical protein